MSKKVQIMNTITIASSSVFVLAVLTVIGCGNGETQSPHTAKPKSVVVQVVEVHPGLLQSRVENVGTIEPKISAMITAPSDGVIEELRVEENDLVRQHQVVAILCSADRLALLGETQARIEHAKALTTGNDNTDSTLQRALEDRQYAKQLFLGTPIVSPIAGRVIDKPVETGSVVRAKQLLLTVADLNQLIIRTAISELLLPKLTLGQTLAVHLDAYPDQKFAGTISLISPHIDAATRTGEVEVRVADREGRLKPGMLATVTIVTERREKALAVPSDAIIVKADGHNVVFVAQDSTARERVITTGIVTKTQTEVREGLHPGERVVVTGQELLKEGMPVKVQGSKE